MNPNLKNRNNCAIYCRLSVEDGDSSESQSINNQKNILTKYALDHGFNIFNIYVDDGFSGTSFNRPAFKQMINDCEQGLIDIVITKDLSRLGRDYLESGRYIERYFPDNNIRYIAVNDNVDTHTDQNTDIIPFKNILNEFYAKDVSKKIRATFRYQREAGIYKQTGRPIYGYIDDPNKNRRVINPETAPIVVKIFNLFINGYSIKGICDYLQMNRISSPLAYWEKHKNNIDRPTPYIWGESTVRNILTNPEYLGHYVKGKTIKKFKTKKVKIVPQEERFIFKNIFDPIITEEVFNLAQSMFVGNKFNSGITNPYAGLVFCGVCGSRLRIQRHKNSNGYKEERLVCANTKEIGKGTILLNDLNEVIRLELLSLKELVLSKKEEFLSFAIEKLKTLDYDTPNTEYEARMITIKQRMENIDNYIQNLLEESVNQSLPEETYNNIMDDYLMQKRSLENEYKKYKLLDDTKNEGTEEANLIKFVERLADLDEENYLSPIIIRNLISKILITTFKPASGSTYNKEIIIYYKSCDSIIKEFMKEKD